ncbi:MAG: leucine--tRNA ligase [Candidatus Pacearchaeota archaeon]
MDYDSNKIEKKWQKLWEEKKVFEASKKSKKEKFYVLEMFPYPSGSGLHMGHALNFTISDIFARYKRMRGFNVLYPIGYDSLGLPAENAAIKEGTHPQDYTNNSIKNFRKQQKALGLSYDYSTLVNTADPDYYKWDQWIFLKMYEKGLAYKKKALVNWCPSCKTVLANEQSQGGVCERCGSELEIKELDQWFFKITDYADELLEGHKKLDWPERTIAMQKNWIGKSHGTEIDFELFNKEDEKFPIFTTRPDTLFGVTFMVISAQHPKLMEIVTKEKKKDVEKFLKKIKSVSEKEAEKMEKEGVFTGSYTINPANGEKVPIWVGNFVVADYGSGMVMAVPAHDQRDFEFAEKYNIPIKVVVEPKDYDIYERNGQIPEAYTEEGTLVNSGEFDGMESGEARKKITEFLIKKNLAKKVIKYRLKDWLISRQRYWGTPIPIVYCNECGEVPLDEKDLPLTLPKKVKFGKGNPLETNKKWVETKCPKCSKPAKRETDTMDTFVNSSWYFLRYCDPKNKEKIFDSKKVEKWCPVDLYVGGAEHACMHLIYARFYTKFLRDLGLIKFSEFAKKLFHQGMLHSEDGRKMSKSLGNTIDPMETIKEYSADSLRLALMSFAAPDKDTNWDKKIMKGSYKFVKKLANNFEKIKIGKNSEDFEVFLNKTIKGVTENIENIEYRKAVIKLRELFDRISKEKEVSKKSLSDFLKMFSLFCPHVSEELGKKIDNKKFISVSKWPSVDKSKLKKKKIEIDLNEKIIGDLKSYLGKVKPEEKNFKKVYVYSIPSEVNRIDGKRISKEIGVEVMVYSVADKDKYDPENMSKNVKPSMPRFYIE